MEGKEVMDMTMAVEGLISLFINMDGNSRGMFIRLLVTKMNDDEIDLILEVIDDRHKTDNGESNGDIYTCVTIKMDEGIVKREHHIDDNDSSYKSSNSKSVSTEFEHVKNNKTDSSLKIEVTIPFSEQENKLLDKTIDKKKFPCDICSKIFNSSISLVRHKKKMHRGENPYHCKYCYKSFAIYSELKKHKTTHPEYEEIIKKYRKKEGALKSQNSKKLICDECGKSFKSSSALKRHILSHTGVKAWECDKCPLKCLTVFDLRAHKLSHAGGRPKTHLCDICSKSFGSNHDLNRHKKIHTGEKGFNCDQCDFETAYFANLKTHMRVHTGERPYSCHICGRSFAQKTHCNRHIRGHTDGKNIFCDKCPKAFLTQDKLKQHSVVHMKEKNYFCDLCPKSFSIAGQLSAHSNIHASVKSVSCEVCGASFATNDHLSKHESIH